MQSQSTEPLRETRAALRVSPRIAYSPIGGWSNPCNRLYANKLTWLEVTMGDTNDSVDLMVRCECGFEARGEESQLVPEVQKHGREAHNMEVTREQVLAMARPA